MRFVFLAVAISFLPNPCKKTDDVPPQPTAKQTEIPAGLLPERPRPAIRDDDQAMREYNKYLAELAKNDAEKKEQDR